jgi:hypothetical protein
VAARATQRPNRPDATERWPRSARQDRGHLRSPPAPGAGEVRSDPRVTKLEFAIRVRSRSPTAEEIGPDTAPNTTTVTPILAPGHLFVLMEPSSPRGRDLDRGRRYALHGTVEDQDGGAGWFRVAGTARRIDDQQLRDLATTYASYTPSDRYVLFELLVDHAFSTVYADDGTPLRERWHGGV